MHCGLMRLLAVLWDVGDYHQHSLSLTISFFFFIFKLVQHPELTEFSGFFQYLCFDQMKFPP